MDIALTTKSIKEIINYCFLLAYCSPEKLAEFREASTLLRQRAAAACNLMEEDFFPRAVLMACGWIVSYHQCSKAPEESLVYTLAEAVQKVGGSSAALIEYQQLMTTVAGLPGRAELKNRIHSKRGCALCVAPCAYGFFSLVSEPPFDVLGQMLQGEDQKPATKDRPVQVLWNFAYYHLCNTLGSKIDFVKVDHLGNLTFCLYLLATAKSRYPFQEQTIRTLQEVNQEMIRRRATSSPDQSQE